MSNLDSNFLEELEVPFDFGLDEETQIKALPREEVDSKLRPSTLDDYIGQQSVKSNFNVYIKSALQRNDVLDHVLLYGPPGLGKTTLSYIIAKELGVTFHELNGATITRIGDIATILANIAPGDVLFIDEIHRMPRHVEEVLYSVLEDFKLSVIVDKNENARSISLNISPFTLVGATTRLGDISAPLRGRFGIIERLDFYNVDEISEIIKRTSKVLSFPIEDSSIKELAIRSRGTPRVANRLFRRVRDFANYNNRQIVDHLVCKETFDALKIDNYGLDDIDRKYLTCLIERYNGHPVGIKAIAVAIGEEEHNLLDACEPYLIQVGLINRTRKGRVATKLAYQHLDYEFKS